MSAYLDNSATTPVCSEVEEEITRSLKENYGNPSSLHGIGLSAQRKWEEDRKILMQALGARSGNLLVTSGGTESNNLSILGTAAAKRRTGNRIVSTAVEHSSVLEPLKKLASEGWDVQLVKPMDGIVRPEDIIDQIDENTVLVSVMKVNNETGAIFDVEKIARLAKQKKPAVTVHCDAVQAFLKTDIDLKNIDLLSVSGHKLHAPKGVGALYIAKGARILPLFFGGGQQGNIRPGTESTLLAGAFAAAVKAASAKRDENHKRAGKLRDMVREFAENTQGVMVNSPEGSLPYLINISIPGIRSETMLHFLEARGIYISSGSACSKGEKSHVLTACGLPDPLIDSALRISFSRYNTEEEVEELLEGLRRGMESLQRKK